MTRLPPRTTLFPYTTLFRSTSVKDQTSPMIELEITLVQRVAHAVQLCDGRVRGGAKMVQCQLGSLVRFKKQQPILVNRFQPMGDHRRALDLPSPRGDVVAVNPAWTNGRARDFAAEVGHVEIAAVWGQVKI